MTTAGDELWQIDVTTPADSALIGVFPSGLSSPTALASHNGVLYCCDDTGNELWQIDVTTPADSVLIGAFPAGLTDSHWTGLT